MHNPSKSKYAEHNGKWLEAERDWAIKDFELPWGVTRPRNVGEEDTHNQFPVVDNGTQKVSPHSP